MTERTAFYELGTDYDGLDGAYVSLKRPRPDPGLCVLGAPLQDWSGATLSAECTGTGLDRPGGPVPWEYLDAPHLASRRLAGLLQASGVDNLEVCPCLLRAAEDAWVSEEFVGLNVTGGIHDAVYRRDGGLAVDPARVPPLRVFLWTHGKVLVDQGLAELIRARGVRGVLLTPFPVLPRNRG